MAHEGDPVDEGLPPGTYVEVEPDETGFARMRVEGRNYITSSFILDDRNSQDQGQPARWVRKVFDRDVETSVEVELDRYVVRESPGGRIQIQLLVAREAHIIKELWIQRVPRGGRGDIETICNLKRADAQRLAELLKLLHFVPIEGSRIVTVDDDLIADLLKDPTAISKLYRRNRQAFEETIADDVNSQDVIALAHRREQVGRFRRLMEDQEFFAVEKERQGLRRDEDVWQVFFEHNPWIFGLGLTGQLITTWDRDQLEKVVAGASIAKAGKRVDALMRTSGRIKSMVFVEIKRHTDDLVVSGQYRSGVWRPSKDLAGGVAQAQGTVHLAVSEIKDRIFSQFDDGTEDLSDPTYLFKPRSFLLIGTLGSLLGAEGGHDPARIGSFELYRRNTIDPEVITFDELLARAEALANPGA